MSDQLFKTNESARISRPKSTDAAGLLRELAQDAANGLLQRMADMHRYKNRQDEIASAHGLATILWNNKPTLIVFSATVMPLEHSDIYGQTFADDLKSLIDGSRLPDPRRCDCENSDCKVDHVDGNCQNVAIQFDNAFGQGFCDECLPYMPKEYFT